MRRRVARGTAAAQRHRVRLYQDMAIWYSLYVGAGGTEDGLPAHLAALAATALPPKDDVGRTLNPTPVTTATTTTTAAVSAGASGGFSTELGVVHAPVRPVTYAGAVAAVLASLRAQPTYRGQLVHVHKVPGQDVIYGARPSPRSCTPRATARVHHWMHVTPVSLSLSASLCAYMYVGRVCMHFSVCACACLTRVHSGRVARMAAAECACGIACGAGCHSPLRSSDGGHQRGGRGNPPRCRRHRHRQARPPLPLPLCTTQHTLAHARRHTYARVSINLSVYLCAHATLSLSLCVCGMGWGGVGHSGKSLVFNLPTLTALVASGGRARALYLFPTKALAQDQCRALRTLMRADPALSAFRAATFDGDTPAEARDDVRAHAHVLLTNPDMLHRTMLPQHRRWAEVSMPHPQRTHTHTRTHTHAHTHTHTHTHTQAHTDTCTILCDWH
jgi:hypothetical protein